MCSQPALRARTVPDGDERDGRARSSARREWCLLQNLNTCQWHSSRDRLHLNGTRDTRGYGASWIVRVCTTRTMDGYAFGRETRWTRGPPPAMSLSIPSEIAQRVHGLCPILGLQWNSARPTNVQDKNWDHRPIAIIPPRTVWPRVSQSRYIEKLKNLFCTALLENFSRWCCDSFIRSGQFERERPAPNMRWWCANACNDIDLYSAAQSARQKEALGPHSG